jgi:hypothetical protein
MSETIPAIIILQPIFAAEVIPVDGVIESFGNQSSSDIATFFSSSKGK